MSRSSSAYISLLFISGHCSPVHSSTCDDSATGHHSTRHLLRPCSVWHRKFNLAVLSCISLTLLTFRNEFLLDMVVKARSAVRPYHLTEPSSQCHQKLWVFLCSLIEYRMCIINLIGKVSGHTIVLVAYHTLTLSFRTCSHWRFSLLVLQWWHVRVTVRKTRGFISLLSGPVSAVSLEPNVVIDGGVFCRDKNIHC